MLFSPPKLLLGNTIILLLVGLPLSFPVAEELKGYDYIATSRFWQKLYPAGGWSFYCGYRFSRARKSPAGRAINIEYIYPTSEMARQAGCENRTQCRETGNREFIKMESDLHNMYPAWQTVITHRYNYDFGVVKGEDWRFEDCDIEWKAGILEPRDIARGNIARTLLYMHSRYNIPVDREALALLKIWNRKDPPSKQELVRNNIIEQIQGNRNPYIDKPGLAESRKISMLK